MTSSAMLSLTLINLLLGAIAGYVMHRADFCVAGMFRDLFLFRTGHPLRPLLLLVACSMLLFEAARQAGLLVAYPFPLIGSPSLANLFGGLLFGVGMVLAGGCVVGTLYKMGSGSVTSLVAFCGLILGSALYAEIHPFWGSVIKKTTFFPGKVTIPQIMGIDPILPILSLTIPATAYIVKVHRTGGWNRRTYAEGALQPWKAALILSLTGTVSYIVIGMPLGITTAYAKIGGWCESLIIPCHFDTLAYFKLIPLNYRNPLTGLHISGGPGPAIDAIALIQFPVIAGIVAGSAFSAIILKEFKIYVNLPLRQYASAALGGLIMGLASRMAPACNVWHLFGGLPIMAIQSILFLIGIVPGAWLGGIILSRKVIR